MLLDQIAPDFAFAVREHIVIDAPAPAVYQAACEYTPTERFVSTGWDVLGKAAEDEIVLGATGRFWTPLRHRHRISLEGWSAVWEPHLYRIVAGLAVLPYGTDRCVLACEARLTPEDPDATSGFRVYWRVLAPIARLIARASLRAIAARVTAPLPTVSRRAE
ncbi:hypothetical protein HFP15_25490 [Amycolatopsis sp. K13G38]|uniref:SRPBCC family protein n=1 Tax=Amycolatopsis acididurans TaxID=2724524 RepID=A0ABX1JCS9_9PSEU|nr:hypothetical protein [Amycolatopsis acididurans]NKQ56236.1 hypothetical protein [Amycolatopsis acididurans]